LGLLTGERAGIVSSGFWFPMRFFTDKKTGNRETHRTHSFLKDQNPFGGNFLKPTACLRACKIPGSVSARQQGHKK
jgi:hypothetical protein